MLRTIFRTRDAEFLRMLNFVRVGQLQRGGRGLPESQDRAVSGDALGTRLFPHRETTERFNLERLNGCRVTSADSKRRTSARRNIVADLKRSAPIPEVLQLKEGALVMIRQNDRAGPLGERKPGSRSRDPRRLPSHRAAFGDSGGDRSRFLHPAGCGGEGSRLGAEFSGESGVCYDHPQGAGDDARSGDRRFEKSMGARSSLCRLKPREVRRRADGHGLDVFFNQNRSSRVRASIARSAANRSRRVRNA